MNKDIIKGHWLEVKGKLKQQWAKLTDDDIAEMEGNQDELMGRLQKHYGFEKDHAHEEINKFLKKNGWDE